MSSPRISSLATQSQHSVSTISGSLPTISGSISAVSQTPSYWDYFVDDHLPVWQRMIAGAALPIAGPLSIFGSITGCNRPAPSASQPAVRNSQPVPPAATSVPAPPVMIGPPNLPPPVSAAQLYGTNQALTWHERQEMRDSTNSTPVVFYRNLHAQRYTGSGATVQEKLGIALYQLEIARSLQREGAQRIFMEGLDVTLAPDWFGDGSHHHPFRNHIASGISLADIRNAFPTGLPAQNALTETQINILYAAGGDFVYATLQAGVTLLRTISPEINESILRDEASLTLAAAPRIQAEIQERLARGDQSVLNHVGPNGEVDVREFFSPQEQAQLREIVHTRRNAAFARELRAQGTEGRIFVVFGANHDFCHALREQGISRNLTARWIEPIVQESELPPSCL